MTFLSESRTPRVGLLFDHDYDALAHARLTAQFQIDKCGQDISRLSGKLQLLRFDFERFADAIAARACRRGWAAVLSHQEFQGALSAALVAERCGLPGTSPESILACHNKLYARQVLERVCPEANAAFRVLDPLADGVPDDLQFPVHVKPVRGTFSILARRLDRADDYLRLTRFSAAERWSMQHLLAPFDRIATARLPAADNACRFLIEEALHGTQHNLDGWVDERGVHLLGIVDAHAYPGTQAFQRWQYPSALGTSVQQQALNVARRFLHAVGFTRGLFNMEFFFNAASNRLSVLEFNPRLSSQFGDLYRQVAGVDPHRMAIALALGEPVCSAPREQPVAQVAASLVWRSFGPLAPPRLPGRSQRSAFAAAFPQATLMTYPRAISLFARGSRWLDSHRYGVINLGASDLQQLQVRSAAAAALLGWPNAPYLMAARAGYTTTSAPAAALPNMAAPEGTAWPSTPAARPAPVAMHPRRALRQAGTTSAHPSTVLPAEPIPHA